MTAPVKIRRGEDKYIIDPLKKFFAEFTEWGEKVRDDIMALEDAVIELETASTAKLDNRPFRRKGGRPPKRYVPKNPGGDPGDPPQDPFI